jgi:molecular chaperone Hsp33
MLLGLGREEVDSILSEQGEVDIGCDFCGRHYRFDAVDVGEAFTPPSDLGPGSASLN